MSLLYIIYITEILPKQFLHKYSVVKSVHNPWSKLAVYIVASSFCAYWLDPLINCSFVHLKKKKC